VNTGNGRLDRYLDAAVKHLYLKIAPEVSKMIRQSFKDGDGSVSFRIKPNGSIGAKAVNHKKIYKKSRRPE
jgi:hypothetical protein